MKDFRKAILDLRKFEKEDLPLIASVTIKRFKGISVLSYAKNA
jgi:hypothetical protein